MTVAFCSWFSGVGMFDLALIRAGFERRGACEIDKFARKVYAARLGAPAFFPEDITSVEAKDVPDADVWIGGAPCQDLSVAGKRAGLDGARSGLVWTWIELAKHKRPTFLLYENVPGLLSINNGTDYDSLLDAFSEIGYLCDAEILDAQNFGVAQRRRRIFIVCQQASSLLKKTHASSATLLGFLADASRATLAELSLPFNTASGFWGGSVKPGGLKKRTRAFETSLEPCPWRNLPSCLDDDRKPSATAPTASSESPRGSGDEGSTHTRGDGSSILSLWREFLDAVSAEERKSTTSTETNTTTTSTIFTFARLLLLITKRIGACWDACPSCFDAARSVSTARSACMSLLEELTDDLFALGAPWFLEARDLQQRLARPEDLLFARDPRDGAVARAVLSEPESVRRGPPTRGEARAGTAGGTRGGLAGLGEQRVARALGSVGGGQDPAVGKGDLIVAATLTSGGHPNSNAPGRRAEDDVNLVVSTLTAGGRETGPHGALDGVNLVAHALQAADGHHGRRSPRGDGGDNLVVAATINASYDRGAVGHNRDENLVPIPFDRAQITHTANRSRCEPGAPSPTLHAGGGAYVAFLDAWSVRGSLSPNQHPCKTGGLSDALDTTGPGAVFTPLPTASDNNVTLRDGKRYVAPCGCSCGCWPDEVEGGDIHHDDDCWTRDRPPEKSAVVSFHATQDPISSRDVSPCLGTGDKRGSATTAVNAGPTVRRLTPMECERLQGLPDGFTCTCGARDEYRAILRAVYKEAQEARLPERACRAAVLYGAEAVVRNALRETGAGGAGGLSTTFWAETRAEAVSDARALVQRLREDARGGQAGPPPQGRQHPEQRSIEHRDHVRELPHEDALVGAELHGAGEQADHPVARPAYWEDCRLPGLTAACKCPDGPRYRAIGNGGAVPVVEWIGRRLLARLGGDLT